ncbi:MAG: hypothetical protein L6R41_006536 [Letrouitia leprolyta]|nr:MAG: hypothetical protein L6R41_006536 [Letrouitia leprolyta]
MVAKRLWPSRTQQYLRWYMNMAPSDSTATSHPSSSGPYTASTYTRHADHTPQTAHAESSSYILALNTDPTHHKTVTALRNKYFPAHLNKLSAHIALFRALPGSELPKIQNAIQNLVLRYHPFQISTGKPFLLSHGVGLEANVKPAQEIFRTLKAQWSPFLSKQDQSFRAHYTIQNKMDDKRIVQKTLEEVQGSFTGSTGMVTGLSLYLYDRGYWRLKHIYEFPAETKQRGQQAPTSMDTGNEDWPALPSK